MAIFDANPAIARLHVEFLWLPETMQGTLWTGIDVLRTAQIIAELQQSPLCMSLSWSVLRMDTADHAGLSLVPEYSSDLMPSSLSEVPTRILIIPGLFVQNAVSLWSVMDKYPSAMEYVTHFVAHEGIVAATFTGLVIPARLGLLKGQKVSVHWAYKSSFVTRIMDADFSGQEKISLQHPVYYCVTPADQMEFMVSILGIHLSEDLAQACRSVLFFQNTRQEITDGMVKENWLSRTSDSPVYRSTQWIQTHLVESYSLLKLAEVARVSERTLLRQFQSVMGMTPLEYTQQLRVDRARLMLEVTINTVQTIAVACGYSDVGSFRRLFVRLVGMTPAEYRKRFALRPKRTRWRMDDE